MGVLNALFRLHQMALRPCLVCLYWGMDSTHMRVSVGRFAADTAPKGELPVGATYSQTVWNLALQVDRD